MTLQEKMQNGSHCSDGWREGSSVGQASAQGSVPVCYLGTNPALPGGVRLWARRPLPTPHGAADGGNPRKGRAAPPRLLGFNLRPSHRDSRGRHSPHGKEQQPLREDSRPGEQLELSRLSYLAASPSCTKWEPHMDRRGQPVSRISRIRPFTDVRRAIRTSS